MHLIPSTIALTPFLHLVQLFSKIKNLFHLSGMLVVVRVEVKVVLHEQHWCCYKVKPTDKLIVTLAGKELGHHLYTCKKLIYTIMSGYVTYYF